jgi:hypothetical protein
MVLSGHDVTFTIDAKLHPHRSHFLQYVHSLLLQIRQISAHCSTGNVGQTAVMASGAWLIIATIFAVGGDDFGFGKIVL